MKQTHPILVEDTLPDAGTVLEGQGIPRWRSPDQRIADMADDAIALYRAHATPSGITREVRADEFAGIFAGEGRNHAATPVGPIFRTSDTLTLFAATVGAGVCDEIASLFRRNEYALASMLDAAASAAAELAARHLETKTREALASSGRFGAGDGVLRFSPGYCGWDVSGQKRLFHSLGPEAIGIALNASYLMQPLKSVSGVIISGPKEIFYFDDAFPFCRACATHTCRDRFTALMDQ